MTTYRRTARSGRPPSWSGPGRLVRQAAADRLLPVAPLAPKYVRVGQFWQGLKRDDPEGLRTLLDIEELGFRAAEALR